MKKKKKQELFKRQQLFHSKKFHTKKITNFFTYVGLRFSGSVEGILCKARPTE